MRDQDALGAGIADLDMGLDGVAAAAHVGRDVGRHMPHAGMKDEMVARALEARGVLRKARPKRSSSGSTLCFSASLHHSLIISARRSGSFAARSSTSEKSRSR